jgi:SsrA-binding protein
MEKREIIKLALKLKQEGMTLIPTKVYFNEALCKVEVALCKGKKLYDKRQSAKEDDQKQHIQKSIKEFGKIH